MPGTVYQKSERSGGVTTRSICADSGNTAISGRPLDFEYQTLGAAPGTGQLILTVSYPLVAAMSASPDTIRLDESSQLVARVSGGIPPYSYNWVPKSGLNSTNISTPLASPSVTTTYTVEITDAAGQILHSDATVRVVLDFALSATPARISPGDISKLNASGVGGLLPYTYSWSPTESFSDPTVPNPGAQPPTTTTYTVTVRDAQGTERTGSIEIVVNLFVSPTANPPTINAGQAAQLDAAPLGGDGIYNYLWSPADGLSDSSIRNPVASPATSTTYTVTVTDGHGVTASGQVPVTINAASRAPTASFTFTRVPCNATTPCSDGSTIGQEVFLNGSNSTGNIASYAWEFDWTPASPDVVSPGPLASSILGEGAQRGNIVLTVTAADGQTASASRRFP